MPPDLTLVVGGFRYAGWKSIRVTRSIESIAGSFALEVSDRWGDEGVPVPIVEWDPCRVEIGGDGLPTEVVIDGFITKRSMSLSATTNTLSYSGRDRSGELVDCSALLEGKKGAASQSITSKKWTFQNVTVENFIRAIADDFDIGVSVQAGLVLPKVERIVIHPGETAWESIHRAAAEAGVLVVSDARGDIVITRSGAGRSAALIQGVNILSASVEYDATNRFHRYLIATQIAGTDDASGEACRIQAEALDLGVPRTERVILIRPEKGYDAKDAKRRADWEARNRTARAAQVTVTVQGWRQPAAGNNALWAVNTLAFLKIPRFGLNGDALISQVEYSIGEGGGQVTQLSLVRPDAFEPEPTAVVHAASGAWAELAGGAGPAPTPPRGR